MKKKAWCVVWVALSVVGCTEVNQEGVGSVAGGVAGGILGNQIGGGSGNVVATVVGAVAGTILGGKIGAYMDRQDKINMERALETAPTGKKTSWKNPDSGHQYSVTPTRTYYRNEQPCREYTTYANIGGKQEQIYGKACRQADGSWRVMN
ncbi:MAG: RT0821/Lpp0805 family surface protein [Legionellaceae bacterium]|nr:RT0821/Lpp0805 family surface protein [Legionellaceae bacterium]